MEENMNPILKKVVLVALTLGLAGCATFRTFSTESRTPDHPIVVDGKADDWVGNLYVVEGERIELGFLNDQEYLYVCLFTTDTYSRAQIMMQGLTIWFDPKGGTEKAFGIKFPLGLPPGERKMPAGENPGEPGLENLPQVAMTEMEIIPSENAPPQKMNLEDAKGVEIKAIPSTGLLVYEFKIPLVRTEQHPIAVGAEPGKPIGIGFETTKLELSQTRRRGSGEIPGGGGRPPIGGGSGRGMGGFDRNPQVPEGMKIWAIVKLAPGQSSRGPQLLSLSR
jgi:hypothetical protein